MPPAPRYTERLRARARSRADYAASCRHPFPPSFACVRARARARSPRAQVATVAINNSTNGALLAIRLLGAFIPSLGDAMEAYQRRIEAEVLVKAEGLERAGYKAYLASGATH